MSAPTTIREQEQFQADRRGYIGGSDVANLFNLEPYYCKLKLYNIKTGVRADTPFLGNRATERGTKLEDMAAEVYAEKTRRHIRRVAPRQHKDFPILRPQPDYEIVNDERGPGLLSVKVPGRENFLRWHREDSPPEPYLLQLQAELAAYNRTWGSYAIFWADGWDLKYWDYNRDDRIITGILSAARDFWENNVLKAVAPEKLDAKSRQCRECEFRIKCHYDNLMKLLEQDATDGQTIPHIPILDALVADLKQAQELVADATELEDEKKEILRKALADADAGEGDHYRVRNLLISGRETLQKEPLIKHVNQLGMAAQKVNHAVEHGKLPQLPPMLQMLVNEFVGLPELLTTKFLKKGSPFRQLRTYELVRKS
jgi:predicted phage-related endonuclease